MYVCLMQLFSVYIDPYTTIYSSIYICCAVEDFILKIKSGIVYIVLFPLCFFWKTFNSLANCGARFVHTVRSHSFLYMFILLAVTSVLQWLLCFTAKIKTLFSNCLKCLSIKYRKACKHGIARERERRDEHTQRRKKRAKVNERKRKQFGKRDRMFV